MINLSRVRLTDSNRVQLNRFRVDWGPSSSRNPPLSAIYRSRGHHLLSNKPPSEHVPTHSSTHILRIRYALSCLQPLPASSDWSWFDDHHSHSHLDSFSYKIRILMPTSVHTSPPRLPLTWLKSHAGAPPSWIPALAKTLLCPAHPSIHHAPWSCRHDGWSNQSNWLQQRSTVVVVVVVVVVTHTHIHNQIELESCLFPLTAFFIFFFVWSYISFLSFPFFFPIFAKFLSVIEKAAATHPTTHPNFFFWNSFLFLEAGLSNSNSIW